MQKVYQTRNAKWMRFNKAKQSLLWKTFFLSSCMNFLKGVQNLHVPWTHWVSHSAEQLLSLTLSGLETKASCKNVEMTITILHSEERLTLKTEHRTSADVTSHASSSISFFKRSVITVGGIISQYLDVIWLTPSIPVERTTGWGSSKRL